MKSQVRFVMHPDDEAEFMAVVLSDAHVVLINGPRWKVAEPEVTRDIASVGHYCIIWSPEDLPHLRADYIPTCNDWYCRSEHATIQLLRSEVQEPFVSEGRIAIATDIEKPGNAMGVEHRYKSMRRFIQKRFKNSIVRWCNPNYPMAPAGPSNSANPSDPDRSFWVGPAAVSWLAADSRRCIKPFLGGAVEGLLSE